MNLATSTSSHLQTLGGTFREKDRPPVIWSAASFTFRLKLSVSTGRGKTTSSRFSLVWKHRHESSCGNQLLPCAFPSLLDHVHIPECCRYFLLVQQSVQRSDIQPTFRNVQSSEFLGNKLSLLKIESGNLFVLLHKSHVMWITYNSWSFFVVFFFSFFFFKERHFYHWIQNAARSPAH